MVNWEGLFFHVLSTSAILIWKTNASASINSMRTDARSVRLLNWPIKDIHPPPLRGEWRCLLPFDFIFPLLDINERELKSLGDLRSSAYNRKNNKNAFFKTTNFLFTEKIVFKNVHYRNFKTLLNHCKLCWSNLETAAVEAFLWLQWRVLL